MMDCYLFQYEMQNGTWTESLKNQDTIDKTCLEGSKVPQQVDKMFILIVDGTTLAIIDPVYSGRCIVHYVHSWFLKNLVIMHLL